MERDEKNNIHFRVLHDSPWNADVHRHSPSQLHPNELGESIHACEHSLPRKTKVSTVKQHGTIVCLHAQSAPKNLSAHVQVPLHAHIPPFLHS